MLQLNNGYLIQESSASILTNIIQDLLDLAQIKAGTFRKNISDFNIILIVNQVMQIQERKALDNNISQLADFDPIL
jgi:signal transduction histidine kinase